MPLLAAILIAVPLIAEDSYESRVGKDFVENTTFRFRTKFNRTYLEDEEFKTLVSKRIEVPPLLDGVLEDDCWKIADHSKSAFAQWLGKEASRKQTVIYVCHDDENFYMATVCEEPVTKGIQMLSSHPGGNRSWKSAGNGDAIEAFIELGGVGGTGTVFQFIYNIHPDVRYDGIYPPYVPFVGTGYKLGGGIGAKRWICEMAFPYKGFNTDSTNKLDYRYQGPPNRGEVWGLRVGRDGPRPSGGEQRMRSTWTYNPTVSWHIPYPTGIIVFDDRNALFNGEFNKVDPESNRPLNWRFSTTDERVEGELVFDEKEGVAILSSAESEADEGVLVTQKFGVLPNVGYRLTARLKKLKGKGQLRAGTDRPLNRFEFTKEGEWEEYVADFFSEPGQRSATVFISLMGDKGSAAIDEIRVEQQIYGAPAGAVCLTGNSPREDLNLETDKLKNIKYTYLEPGTDKEQFPFRKRWSTGWIHGHPDPGGTTGWIPVTKGSLTSPDHLQHMIQWSHARPTAGFHPYPKGHEIIVDLGKEYYVRSVEFLPSGTIANMTVSVRSEGGSDYILTRKLRGAGVLNPPGPVLYGRLNRIKSVGRYIKLWFAEGWHGVYFLRVWGEEKKTRKGITRFRWKEGLVVPEKKYRQFKKLKGPVLMPPPQEVKWGDGEFVLKEGVPVYYRAEGKGKSTAQILKREIWDEFRISVQLVEQTGKENESIATGAIVIGEVYEKDDLANRLAISKGWDVNARRPGPQGYFMSTSPSGILICGFDQAGTFYGVQTLMQLLVRKDFKTAVARTAEIRDWPYIPWRIIDSRGGVTAGMLRGLARMKANVIKGGTGKWAKMADEHFFVSLPGFAGGGPSEMDDDENWYHLGLGKMGLARVNACPSHFLRYESYDRTGRRAFGGKTVGAINLVLDEMGMTRGGSRWNADRRCLARQMTGGDLFTEMIIRAYDLFRESHRKTAFLDTMMMPIQEGGNGSYHNMYEAFEQVPEDIHVYCWKGIIGQDSSDPEEAVQRFERTTMLQGSFPLTGRGKINEYYKAPAGKRVWGVWNTVWGAAGPPGQVLTGQFCRSMTMVDGGCIVPFMTNAWNPDSPPLHTEEWVLSLGHLQQRVAELALERQLPSWRDEVNKDFFKVDMADFCNWSHVDQVPGDGKDWVDWGPNNDLRHLPRGEVQFEEVPFTVLDPAKNGGKTIMAAASFPKNSRLKLQHNTPEVPVNRKASSLIFLRTNIGGGKACGYRITYEGNKFLTAPLDALGNLSAGYSCYGLYPPGQTSGAPDNPRAFYKSAKHRMSELFSLFFRPAWLGVTGCGDPVKITMHEWVNPYPDLTIKSVSFKCPPGRTSGRIEVLFAITGIATTPYDVALWKDRKKMPLVPVNTVELNAIDVPVIPPEGTWSEDEEKPWTLLDENGNEVCELKRVSPANRGAARNLFKRLDSAAVNSGVVIKLASPQACKKIAVAGQYYWEYFGPKVHYGVNDFSRVDYVIEVSADGKQWVKVGDKKGVCGEDGEHVHALPKTPIQYVRLKTSGKDYISAINGGQTMGSCLSWIQLYK